jgi:ActD protein
MNVDVDLIKDKLGIGDDKLYGVMGEFSEPHDLVEAGRKIRQMGYTKLDAMSPFPVHGIDEAIGVPPSKLGWIVIFFSALGGLTALILIWYVGVISYPLVIGGKPLFDFSYSIPVTFELTVLCTAFATFFGMFLVNGLPRLYHPSFRHPSSHRASDDRFLLVIEADDPQFDPQKSAEHLRSVGAAEVEVVEG